MGLSINDSVYSCLFFFLTGLHFFHLLLGLLLSLLFWSCSFSFSIDDYNSRLKRRHLEEGKDQGKDACNPKPSCSSSFSFSLMKRRKRKNQDRLWITLELSYLGLS